jgi:hypothetical protein
MTRRAAAAAAISCLAVAFPLHVFGDAAQRPVASADPPSLPAVVSGVWQQHKLTVNYFGITTAYSCDSLEQRVRDILLYFGARKDAKVSANGCPGGPEVPSHNAWIQADFYTLAEAESASSGEAVKAQWAPREITPRRPFYMGDGDCELIEQMKDLISKSFSLRELQYQTECVPHEIVVDGFDIKARALIALDQPPS